MGRFSAIHLLTFAAKITTSILAAVRNRSARRGHAAKRASPLITRDNVVRRRGVAAKSAATMREAHLSPQSAQMQRAACAVQRAKSTRAAYAVLLVMSSVMGSVVGALVQVANACRRWRNARPKALLATARQIRLVLIPGSRALRDVAIRSLNRVCFPGCSYSWDTSNMYFARSYLYY